MPNNPTLPERLTVDEAVPSSLLLTDLYAGVESSPGDGLVLFEQAVGKALRPGASPDPLIENLDRD